MKNKVDISKIIKQKYEEDTFELNDLLEEIDLVLNESDQSSYHSKVVRNGVSDSIPEKLSQGLDVQRHVNNSLGTNGAPRQERPGEPGYGGREPSNIVPDKIAEDTSLTEASEQESISVTVPDLFSVITNSELDIKDDDRQIINDIVESFRTSSQHWSENIKSIQQFIIENASEKGFSGDLREAISKLIYLNLFKKISYFTAQPGKLFEYIIAPIIGKDSKVVGKDDQDIIDVDSANTNGYSIKLFTGAVSNQAIQGSIERLREVATQIPVQYIIAVVDKELKTISFVELAVSLNAEHFRGWKVVNETKEGVILSKLENQITKYGILVKTSEEASGEFVKDVIKILGSNIKTDQLQARIDSINTFLENPNINDLIKNIIRPFKDIEEIVKLRIASELPESDKRLSDKNIVALNKKKPKYFENLISYILKELEKAKQQQSPLKEATDGEGSVSTVGKFNIPIKGSWKNLSSISLELGDPKVYNQFQLKIASEIQKTMVNVLNNFSSLGKNITLYFGTTAHKQMTRRAEMTTYAQSCVDDANKIVTGIKEIATSEGESIK
jgi:hypothetical protein